MLYECIIKSYIDQAISQLRRSFNKLIQWVVPWQIIFIELIVKQFIFAISFNAENNPMRPVHILFVLKTFKKLDARDTGFMRRRIDLNPLAPASKSAPPNTDIDPLSKTYKETQSILAYLLNGENRSVPTAVERKVFSLKILKNSFYHKTKQDIGLEELYFCFTQRQVYVHASTQIIHKPFLFN